jgi:hypothetical protein
MTCLYIKEASEDPVVPEYKSKKRKHTVLNEMVGKSNNKVVITYMISGLSSPVSSSIVLIPTNLATGIILSISRENSRNNGK